VSEHKPVSLMERVAYTVASSAATLTALYVWLNFDTLNAKYGIAATLLPALAAGAFLIAAGPSLAERLQKDREARLAKRQKPQDWEGHG
jgi:hypothetical protein